MNGQAVAVLVANDMAAFYACGFYGGQDTLFDFQGRHYYKDCYIEGTVDFIFGDGQSQFIVCDLQTVEIVMSQDCAHSYAITIEWETDDG